MATKNKSIRFAEDVSTKLDELAKVSNRPVNFLVNAAVRRMIQNYEAIGVMIDQAEEDSRAGRMIAQDKVEELTEAALVRAEAKHRL